MTREHLQGRRLPAGDERIDGPVHPVLRAWVGLEEDYELARDGVCGNVDDIAQKIREAAQRLLGQA
jgi:hypothetical protein